MGMALPISFFLVLMLMLMLHSVASQPSPGYFPSSKVRTLGFYKGFANRWGPQHQWVSPDQSSSTIWLDRSSGKKKFLSFFIPSASDSSMLLKFYSLRFRERIQVDSPVSEWVLRGIHQAPSRIHCRNKYSSLCEYSEIYWLHMHPHVFSLLDSAHNSTIFGMKWTFQYLLGKAHEGKIIPIPNISAYLFMSTYGPVISYIVRTDVCTLSLDYWIWRYPTMKHTQGSMTKWTLSSWGRSRGSRTRCRRTFTSEGAGTAGSSEGRWGSISGLIPQQISTTMPSYGTLMRLCKNSS